MKALGELVARLRTQRGIETQKALADAIRKDTAWVSFLEGGRLKVPPDPALMERMASVLGVAQVELLIAAGYDVGGHDEAHVITLFEDDPRARLVRAAMPLTDQEVEQWVDALTAWEARRHAS